MTALLVVGLIGLIYGMARTARDLGGTGFGVVELALPAGSRVAGWQASGDRLLLELAGPGEDDLAILAVDLASGRSLGTIRPRASE